MALIDKDDIKLELGMSDTSYDILLDFLAEAIQSLFAELSNFDIEYSQKTEYFNSEKYCNHIFLKDIEIDSTQDFNLWDDPDWIWGSDTLVDSADYRVDYKRGIVYSNTIFHQGNQSLKVQYYSGYTDLTIPSGIKQIWVRQACHWFQDAKNREWAMSSKSQGKSTISYRDLQNNMLPEFIKLIESFPL